MATARVLLVSKKPCGSFDISIPNEKQKKKEKKNLSCSCEDAMACVPVSTVLREILRGWRRAKERGGEKRGEEKRRGRGKRVDARESKFEHAVARATHLSLRPDPPDWPFFG